MKKHKRIIFFKAPLIWIGDKYRALANKPALYFSSSPPTLFSVFAIFASYVGISNFNENTIMLVLLWFLFFYGIINLVLIFALQRSSIQLERVQGLFKIVHRDIVHKIRDYIALKMEKKKEGESLSSNEIAKNIEDILDTFNKTFLKELHRYDVTTTLKYLFNDELHPIRIPKHNNRFDTPENLDESYVYKALNKPKQQINYLYIKNLNNPDNIETHYLGRDLDFIRQRALDKYETFIAIPIRSGSFKKDGDLEVKKHLGFLGIDMEKKFGFGNLYDFEINAMCILTDTIAELVDDLIDAKINEVTPN